jgi:hypothetical protein
VRPLTRSAPVVAETHRPTCPLHAVSGPANVPVAGHPPGRLGRRGTIFARRVDLHLQRSVPSTPAPAPAPARWFDPPSGAILCPQSPPSRPQRLLFPLQRTRSIPRGSSPPGWSRSGPHLPRARRAPQWWATAYFAASTLLRMIVRIGRATSAGSYLEQMQLGRDGTSARMGLAPGCRPSYCPISLGRAKLAESTVN